MTAPRRLGLQRRRIHLCFNAEMHDSIISTHLCFSAEMHNSIISILTEPNEQKKEYTENENGHVNLNDTEHVDFEFSLSTFCFLHFSSYIFNVTQAIPWGNRLGRVFLGGVSC